MKTLSIKLNYGRVDRDRFRTGGGVGNDLVLPVQVMNQEGAVLANGAVGVEEVKNLQVPTEDDPLFVKLTWPSGQSVTKKVGDAEGAEGVVFDDESLSPDEWDAWAVPRLNQRLTPENRESRPAPAVVTPPSSSQGSQRLTPQNQKGVASPVFGDAAVSLWRRMAEANAWVPAPMAFERVVHGAETLQFELRLTEGSWLLQLQGSKLNNRFISLPGGPCRVLVTPNQSRDPRAEPLKVLVTSFRHGVETLLEYLSRDSLQAAESLATNDNMAMKAFSSKDPYIAIAGAYYLLRMDYWREESSLQKFKRLYDSFSGSADAALIYSTVLVRQGLANEQTELEALTALERATESGYPVYSEAMRLFQELVGVLKYTKSKPNPQILGRAQSIVEARAWAGSSFSFYGEEAKAPMPLALIQSKAKLDGPLPPYAVRLQSLLPG